MAITDLSQLDLDGTYSYADYLTWKFDERVELIKGKISLMCPAPNVQHQQLSVYLTGTLFIYFQNKPCQLFAAPFDVRLYDRRKSILQNKEIFTVVQPDICVICDENKLDKQGCNGAPDWIIEIISKSTAKKDAKTKYELYAENGVKEYWLVYPSDQVIQQFLLHEESQQYQLANIYTDEKAVSYLFPDLEINLAQLFKD